MRKRSFVLACCVAGLVFAGCDSSASGGSGGTGGSGGGTRFVVTADWLNQSLTLLDYDKLTMNIETDGSVRPEDTVALAARIIQDQLSVFVNFEEPKKEQPYERQRVYSD